MKSEHVEVDLHGFYPHERDLLATIERTLREASESGAKTVKFIHGHGFNRASYAPVSANTNTGRLGLSVRSYLRNTEGLRAYMLAKIDVSDIGATTVRIRR